MPAGNEHVEVRLRQGAACIAGISDILDGAEDAEERPRREAACRGDSERRALMENRLL